MRKPGRVPLGRPVLLAAGALTAVVFGVVGGAVAHWPGSGGGSGTAGNAATDAVELTPAAPVAELFPGGQAAVALVVTNPNPVDVRLQSLALDTGLGTDGFGVDAGHAGCVLSTLSFPTQTNGGAGWLVPADDDLELSLPAALSMDSTAAHACQGAEFTVHLRAGP